MTKRKEQVITLDESVLAKRSPEEQQAAMNLTKRLEKNLKFKDRLPVSPNGKTDALSLVQLAETTKATDINVARGLVANAAAATQATTDDSKLEWAFSQIADLEPRTPLEGMLISQMVAVNTAIGRAMRLAWLDEQTSYGKESNMNYAVKLQKVFLQQAEALQKLRGKGQQTVRVEHVTVNAGGQAIVGHVEHSNGGG